MKQTAVNWLVEKIQQANPSFKFDALVRQAKQMEKEQIESAWIDGVTNWDSEKEVEDYINETFKSE